VAAKKAEQEQLATLAQAQDIRMLVAVATKGQGKINEHFGHATEFQIYELDAGGSKFVGHRRVDLYCQGGWGEEDTLETVIRAINDCHAVFVAKIGACPRADLAQAGIDPVERFAHQFIEQSALAYFREYVAKVAAGEIVHAVKGDAQLRQGAYIAAA